jgi:carbon storage regulator CsrA
MHTSINCKPRDLTDETARHGKGSAIQYVTAGRKDAVSHFIQPRLSCVLQNGIPMVRGTTSSYYIFNQKGQRLLILTRKHNQSIVIDNAIDIVVLEVNCDEVKLGIICPDDMLVGRNEDRTKNRAAPRPRQYF